MVTGRFNINMIFLVLSTSALGLLPHPLVLSLRHFLREGFPVGPPCPSCFCAVFLQYPVLFCFLSKRSHLCDYLIYLCASARLSASCMSVFLTTYPLGTYLVYILGERSKQLNKWVWSLGGRLQLLSSDSHLDSTFLGQS